MRQAVSVCYLLAVLAALAVLACDDERPVTGIDAANPSDGGAESGDDAASD
jgi:hypothetical protein